MFVILHGTRKNDDVTKRHMSWNAKSVTSYSVDVSSGYIDQCGMSDRFSSYSEEELEAFLDDSQRKITKKSIKYVVRIFDAYLVSIGDELDAIEVLIQSRDNQFLTLTTVGQFTSITIKC